MYFLICSFHATPAHNAARPLISFQVAITRRVTRGVKSPIDPPAQVPNLSPGGENQRIAGQQGGRCQSSLCRQTGTKHALFLQPAAWAHEDNRARNLCRLHKLRQIGSNRRRDAANFSTLNWGFLTWDGRCALLCETYAAESAEYITAGGPGLARSSIALGCALSRCWKRLR